MLKIKDNVDLKELEKFGFRKAKNYAYGYYFKYYNDCFRVAICKGGRLEHKEREIFVDALDNLYDVIDEWNILIYDLIQAGLVEKVVD